MAKKPRRQKNGTTGLGVDYAGNPVLDPTQNVIALSEAANLRQDNLRDINNERIDSDLKHLREMAELRAHHETEIQQLETSRLNAIRQVDVAAVTIAADRAQASIDALSRTMAQNADNLRTIVDTTAKAMATQTAATVGAITDRIAMLEKLSYEGRGRSAYTDPVLAELVTEMKGLRESHSEGKGKGEGVSATFAAIMSGFGLLLTLVTLATVLIHLMGGK